MNAQSFKKINRDNHKKLESSKLSIRSPAGSGKPPSTQLVAASSGAAEW